MIQKFRQMKIAIIGTGNFGGDDKVELLEKFANDLKKEAEKITK